MFFAMRLRELAALLLALALIALSLALPRAPAAPVQVPVTGARAAPQEAGPVLVIDAGHGGEDGGAASAEGLLESGVNLSVARRLEAVARLFGVETRMTRETEAIDYPPEALTVAQRKRADQQARLALIRAQPGALLISIHQNAYPDPRPSGCQVLYAGTPGSEALGKLAHANLTAALCPESRRVAAPAQESIYLMRSVSCTAILVECGFLSNPEEAARLATDGYQKKIAAVLLASYLQYQAQPDGTEE